MRALYALAIAVASVGLAWALERRFGREWAALVTLAVCGLVTLLAQPALRQRR